MSIVNLNDNIDLVVNYLPIKELLKLSQTNKFFYKYIKNIKRKRKITKSNYYKLKISIDFWRTFHMKLFYRRKNVNSWRKRIKDPESEILLF